MVGSNIELVKSGNLSAPRREIDDATRRRCDLIVALSKAQAIDSQQGDIYWPVQNGVITWEKIVEISDVLSGKGKGRTDDEQIILYKTRAARELSISRWRKNAMSWRKRIIKDMSCALSRDSIGGCKEGAPRPGE